MNKPTYKRTNGQTDERKSENYIPPHTSYVGGIINFTTLLANSADDKLVIFFIFFPETGFDISCKLSHLHEISKSVFWEKYFKLFSAENDTQSAKR